MQERFKVILQDIKKKHQNDASTSNYNPENSSDFYDEVYNAVMSTEGSPAKKLLAALRTSFMLALDIKNSESNKHAAESLVKSNFSNEKAEAFLTQSELVEPDARKRRKASKKIKDM